MPKRPIVFGVGVGIIFSCLALYFIYTNQLLNATEGEPSETPAAATVSPFLTSETTEALPAGTIDASLPPNTPEPTALTVSLTSPPPQTDTPHLETTAEPIITPDPTPEPTVNLEPTPTPKPSVTPEAEPTPEPTVIPEPTPIPEAIIDTSASGDRIRVTIPDGLNATQVVRVLRDAGVIDDADGFLALLREKGYTYNLSSGTFNFTANMSYEELAELIARK